MKKSEQLQNKINELGKQIEALQFEKCCATVEELCLEKKIRTIEIRVHADFNNTIVHCFYTDRIESAKAGAIKFLKIACGLE